MLRELSVKKGAMRDVFVLYSAYQVRLRTGDGGMAGQCEYVEGCPMFKYFRSIAKKVYAEIYCLGDYEVCRRRQLRQAGEPVPQNLLPHGGKLWDDDQKPPDFWV
jgi:hypothetical protein